MSETKFVDDEWLASRLRDKPVPVAVIRQRSHEITLHFRQHHPGRLPCYDCRWEFLFGSRERVEQVHPATGFRNFQGGKIFLCGVHWDIREVAL